MSPIARGKSQISSTTNQYKDKPIFPLLSKHPIFDTFDGRKKSKSKMNSLGNEHHNRSVEALLNRKRKSKYLQQRTGPQSIQESTDELELKKSQD